MLVETIVGLFSGYVFWLIIAKFASSGVIGTSSAVISLSTIVMTVATMGIPLGVERFLGKSFSSKHSEAKHFVEASTILVSIGIVLCSIVMLIFRDSIQSNFKIDLSLLVLAILLMCSSSIFTLFRSVLIASLKTKTLPLILIISAGTKMGVTILLVLIGMGTVGIIFGFILNSILGSILLGFVIGMIFKGSERQEDLKFKETFKNILSSSMANWIPLLIATMGSQLGTVLIFASRGASQTGVYFIALSIVTGLSAVATVLFTVAFPALSNMTDGRKRFVGKITNLSNIFAIPFTASAFFYSKEIMQLFGPNYDSGSFILQIMLLSILPGQIASGINTLTYSYGKYRQVLVMGISGNGARVLFLSIMVPIYGGIGGAISFTLGTVVLLIVAIIISRKINFIPRWDKSLVIFTIPFGIGFVLSHFGANLILGSIVTIIGSYLLFLRIHFITRSDLRDSIGSLPSSIANPTLNILNKIAKKLDKSY